MTYEEIPVLSRSEIEDLLLRERGGAVAGRPLVRGGEQCPIRIWAESVCVRLSEHPDPWARGDDVGLRLLGGSPSSSWGCRLTSLPCHPLCDTNAG